MTNSTVLILLILGCLISAFVGFNVGKTEGEYRAYNKGKEEGYTIGYSEAEEEMKAKHFEIILRLSPYTLKTYQNSVVLKSVLPFPEDFIK